MENDSPNLFDSEPFSVKLTVAGKTDDALTELVEEINTNVERNVDVDDEMDSDEVPNAVAEYRTDDEGEQDRVAEGPVERPSTDSPETKAKYGSSINVERNIDVDDEMDSDEVPNDAAEYRTDDEDEEDRVADESVERPSTDSPKTKVKDGLKGLPPGRVKLIMKMDPDINIVTGEAVFLVTKATENFVGLLAQHCHKAMVSSNKKTLQKKHIDTAIEENVPFEFLEGALDWY